MRGRVSGTRRKEIERSAKEIYFEGIRRGWATEETADRILVALPEVLPLEAWRFANGWTRAEISARLDALYQADGLAGPGLDGATLCRWEHGERRPSDERIDYLCRLYRTRPDRLGFGADHSPGDVDRLSRAGIIDAFPHTSRESEEDLIRRISNARQRVNLFGLTRNFYGNDMTLPHLEAKAAAVPIQIFVMDPLCPSREDRYRIEPAEAAMEDPERYVREILRPLHQVTLRRPKLRVFLYNFPCSFGIEEIDDVCRIMLYGHGKRGTQGPIMTFSGGGPAHTYFVDQIRWLERCANSEVTPEPWAGKGVRVRPLEL